MPKVKRYTISQLRSVIRPIATECNVSEAYFLKKDSKPNSDRFVELVYNLNPWATSDDLHTFERTLYKKFPDQIVLTGVHSSSFIMQEARENGKPLFN